MKLLTDYERVYYKPVICNILSLFKENESYYTSHFRYAASTVRSDIVLLRRILRTLEADGTVQNINLGFNDHKWKLSNSTESNT